MRFKRIGKGKMSNKKEQVKKAELSKAAKIIKKTVNFITLLVVIAVVIFAFLIVGIRAFGVNLYIILSGWSPTTTPAV